MLRLAVVLFTLALVGCDQAHRTEVPTTPAPPSEPKVPFASTTPWKLVWRDEFDGKDLDLTKWNYRQLGKRESAMITKDCISLDGNGTLHVWVKEKDGVLQNGMIGTQGKFDVKFGVIAARIKFPRQQGQHGSLWMQPAKSEKVADNAALSGCEIDIIEWFGAGRRDGGTASNVYWGWPSPKAKRIGSMRDFHSLLPPGKTWSDDFHVYSLEWTPEEYIFRINEHETFRFKEGVSHQPQYLILSLLTADWEADRLDRSLLPNSMEVDWVRVWKAPEKE